MRNRYDGSRPLKETIRTVRAVVDLPWEQQCKSFAAILKVDLVGSPKHPSRRETATFASDANYGSDIRSKQEGSMGRSATQSSVQYLDSTANQESIVQYDGDTISIHDGTPNACFPEPPSLESEDGNTLQLIA